jgi:hypothetical protein
MLRGRADFVVVRFFMLRKEVQKEKPRTKRSISSPGDDHELGLWIDYDLLRNFVMGHPRV